ncbi:hypothetical protein CMU59_11705 [Elizabethkingia anophelis]|uniref:YecA family protein n=1 Tax=Elizabethkingia anophelis TaxID=1117645 RepID=UPI0021A6AAE1|nr:SEC-C domain-containing protein [Elizabethkingia anophelis]MCT3947682.1 SEC-C domain-containing protein [Elizabethkingia anophelis]MDV3573716.1 hypothetical protein [Elizabethkingia anophelis]MDV3598390.1 hypothetical protein [Elizabethkingia anophelis]MDV3606161.1 hypothetical protein [Elizabethkingia anophelis]
MRIGRNARCPCGSGLKYKKCCINKPKYELPKRDPVKKTEEIPFFTKFDRVELLKTFSALSIIPENHGKYIRLEELVIRTLIQTDTGNDTTDKAELEKFFDINFVKEDMEDICINTFTDLITFHGGDYITFPGITESGQEILSNQLGSIFHMHDNNIPDWFKSNTMMVTLFMLGISDLIAKRLGYCRYMKGIADENKIFVPDEQRLQEAKQSIVISNEEMKTFLEREKISPDVVEIFTIDPEKEVGELSLNPYGNPILYKPILKTDEGFVILSPSTICLALSGFIWRMAIDGACMKEVNDTYHAFTWNNINHGLRKLGFDHIEIPEIELEDETKAGFYRFDDDKIAFIRYICDSGENYGDSQTGFGGFATLEDIGEPKKIIEALKNIPSYKHFKIFSISILSGIGGEMMYSIKDDGADRILAMPIQELNTMAQLTTIDALDMWKFAIARDNIAKSNPMFFSLSVLDLMKVFRENSDSFYLSDYSKGVVPYVEPGYAREWYLEAKLKSDKHSVLRRNGDGYSFVGVELKDSYMPIYYNLYDVSIGNPKFAVGGYSQPIWIMPESMPEQASIGLKSMYLHVSEGIGYWLWQIQNNIKDVVSNLGDMPIEISFEFDKVEKFNEIGRDFQRIENLESFFSIEFNAKGFKVIIPSEIIPYLYGDDNEGERILVRQILKGFNEMLFKGGHMPISDEKLEEIMETDVPLGMKKKFYIYDTSDNLLIDPTNLKEYRYIQDYDTGSISDQIVEGLGDMCPPIGEIETVDERKDLARSITNKVLFRLLNEKLEAFNSEELLKRLIGLNESLIKERELLKIHIPTRIACFVSEEQQISELHESLSKMNRTTIAVRCLIEHIAAEQKSGKEVASTTDIDELIAIMDQVISWGSIGDMIHFELFDIKMSVLPSGRIGTQKKSIADVFDPYHKSKTTENVQDAVKAFNQVFPKNIVKEEASDIPEKLDKAFIADYGVSFTMICHFSDILSYIGFSQSQDYASLPLKQLKTEINRLAEQQFSDTEFDSILLYLSLEKRGTVHKIKKDSGFDISDIIPWKFNRMLSLLRKPLIIFGEHGEKGRMVFWGARQVLDSKRYLAEQCQSGRLRVPKENSAIISVLGTFAQDRGDGLVKAIIDSIDPKEVIIDQERFIGPGFEFKHTEDIGDIDVLIIDTSRKVIFSLESKSMSPSRNIMEMVSEVNKLFGSENEKGWIDKHMVRHEWLKNNKKQLTKKYGVDVYDFEVRSFFVTEEDMLTPHLIKLKLPLPFITRYDLDKNGYQKLLNTKLIS